MIHGTFSGLASNEFGKAFFGRQATAVGTQSAPMYGTNVYADTIDVVAAAYSNSTYLAAKVSRATMMIDSDLTLDFDMTTAFAPETHNASVVNALAGETIGFTGHFITDLGTQLMLGGTGSSFLSVPAAEMSGNDVSCATAEGSMTGAFRSATIWGTTLTDLDFTLPDPIATPTGSFTADRQLRLAFSAVPNADLYQIDSLQWPGGAAPLYLIDETIITKAWLSASAATSTIVSESPNLETLPGWQSDWSFVSGVTIDWSVAYLEDNLGAVLSLPTSMSDATPASYATRMQRSSAASGMLTP
jgi:hypothetical protein